MEENTYSEQFAEDYLLVAMNDEETYTRLIALADKRSIPQLSDKLREDWDTMVDEAIGLVRNQMGETSALFLAQALLNTGSRPFDLIARSVIEKAEEVSA